MSSVNSRNSNMVPRLLGLGADPDAFCGENGSPMSAACFKGHNTIVNMLLDHASSKLTGAASVDLYNAVCRGAQEQTALLLIQKTNFINSEVEYQSAFAQASRSGFTKVVSWLQRPSFARMHANAYAKMIDGHFEFLTSAIKQRNVPMLQTLMREGPESPKGRPPDAMAIASLAGQTKMMRYLQQTCTLSVEQEGVFGSPLRSASLMGHTNTVRILLYLGAHNRNSSSPYATKSLGRDKPKIVVYSGGGSSSGPSATSAGNSGYYQ